MRKINYRITVNITQKTMKLGFRAKMPDEMQGKRIRVQAVFTQRQVERRFPMEVVIEEGEVGDQIRADAEILLPYVFYSPPRHKVNVIFTLWCGAEEICLDDQPFPVQKELFARAEIVRKRNLFMHTIYLYRGRSFLFFRESQANSYGFEPGATHLSIQRQLIFIRDYPPTILKKITFRNAARQRLCYACTLALPVAKIL